jgi:hypothetical protein
MGLIMNVYRDSVIPFTQFGGLTMSSEFPNFNGEENWPTIFMGEGGFTDQTSMPDGNYPPVTWKLPLKAGAISARNKMIGSGSLTASGNLGYQILASLSGSGTISDALGTLIIDLIASISGEGTISSAAMEAFLFALADLTGEGGITDAELLGVGELLASLAGEGIITSTLLGDGELSAAITSYGSLTPEGIRDSIWGAIASNYNVTGTMGQKLNSAAVGGVDYNALAEAVLDAEISGRNTGSLGKAVENTEKKSNMIPGLY